MGRVVVLVVLLMTGSAQAGEPGRPWWSFLWTRLGPIGCCPDDYCAKPYPCVPACYRPKGCDDYGSKPLPCIPPCYWPKGCDDYHGKPLPCWPCTPAAGAVCPPGDGCGKRCP